MWYLARVAGRDVAREKLLLVQLEPVARRVHQDLFCVWGSGVRDVRLSLHAFSESEGSAGIGECGTYNTVTARFWPWLEGKSYQNGVTCSFFAR